MSAKNQMTHTGTIEKRAMWGEKGKEQTVKLREIKTAYITESGTCYLKSTGKIRGGHHYHGVYMESTQLNISSVKLLDVIS